MGHHYVPRWILRQFEDSQRPGFVWQYDKRGGQPVQAAIKRVAQESGFYEDETEILLAQEVERPGSQAIQELLGKKPLSLEQRVDLAIYLGSMLRRVPHHRQWSWDLFQSSRPELLESVRDRGLRLIHEIAAQNQHDEDWVNSRVQWVEKAIKNYETNVPQEVIDQINSPFPSTAVVLAILDMTWRIAESTGPQYFVTSDNPAGYIPWKGYGLGGAEAEFVFPLSKTMALHGSRQRAATPLVFQTIRQQMVREINKRVVTQATRFVYTHEKVAWLSSLLPIDEHRIMRLGW